MGVPKFYRWISERYPCLSEVVKEYQIPEFDNLYLDMNGIIHTCSHPEDDNPHFRITEEKIFEGIFHYIEVLFRMIKPKKVFFMAIDGVAPRAKMNQQRGRRFRSARDAEELIKKALEKGEVLPSEDRFDSNCITPGTPFMVRLHNQLQYFVTKKISTDSNWKGVRVILSGHETPGEGEHKIMDFIRYEKAKPGHDPNSRHCLYGLDADLIMLGLITHEPHFSLLREEVRFGGKNSQKRSSAPEETTFHLLHLSLMREYLDYEFAALKDKIPDYNLENIIDDWVLMGYLVGNDFVPHLPHVHIHQECLPLLWRTYMETRPKMDGYLNENGDLNLPRFEQYLEKLSEHDIEQFRDSYADLKWLEGKIGGKAVNEEAAQARMSKSRMKLKKLEKFEGIPTANEYEELMKFEDMDVDEELERLKEVEEEEEQEEPLDEDYDSDEQFELEFRSHKDYYYKEKMNYPKVTPDVLAEQAHGYVRALQWILHYYYNGVPSWSWFYPHHYAPHISDVRNFSDMKIKFDKGRPFLPFEQLMAVLPAASKKLLPLPLQALMTNDTSSVVDFYPVNFDLDMNGKLQEWEAVVVIPFIDENRLLRAMEPALGKMTDEEKSRNCHGPHRMYEWTDDDLGTYVSPTQGYFPDVHHHHAKETTLHKFEFVIAKEKLKKGLCKGVKLDVYYPGFPTLKHIEHTATLKKSGVKVFQMNSRGENMMLSIVQNDHPDLEQVSYDLIGKTIYVGWPHMVEARVVSCSDGEWVYKAKEHFHTRKSVGSSNSNKVEIEYEALSNTDMSKVRRELQNITNEYHDRRGIETGRTAIVLYACPMTGRKYICGSHGNITLEKQWSPHPVPYALQATVKDIAVHDSSFMQYKSLDELFPVGSDAFMLGSPHYGCMGQVLDIDPKNDGRIRVDFSILQEPDFENIARKESSLSLNYMPSYIIGRRLGISGALLSRITGTIFVNRGSRKQPSSGNRISIGLNLKSNKKNEEVAGFTKKVEDKWMYSTKTLQAVAEYIQKFPELFDLLSQDGNEDMYYEDDIFEESGRLKEVTEFIKGLPCASAQRITQGSETLDELVVKEIEKEVEKIKERNNKKKKRIKMQVRPHLLYRPIGSSASLIPDNSATYEMYDRIVNVREGFSVPLGLRGTVIGLYPAAKEEDSIYDVVFDEEFLGGLTLRCTQNRGYRMPPYAMVNLTHGERKEQSRSGGNPRKPTAVVKPQTNQYGQSQNASYSSLLSKSAPQDNRHQPRHQHQQHFNQQMKQIMTQQQGVGRQLFAPTQPLQSLGMGAMRGTAGQDDTPPRQGQNRQHTFQSERARNKQDRQQQLNWDQFYQSLRDDFAKIWSQLSAGAQDTPTGRPAQNRTHQRGGDPKGPSLQQAAQALQNLPTENYQWKNKKPKNQDKNRNTNMQDKTAQQQSSAQSDMKKIDLDSLFASGGKVTADTKSVGADKEGDNFMKLMKALEISASGEKSSDESTSAEDKQKFLRDSTAALCQALKVGASDKMSTDQDGDKPKGFGRQVSIQELFQGAQQMQQHQQQLQKTPQKQPMPRQHQQHQTPPQNKRSCMENLLRFCHSMGMPPPRIDCNHGDNKRVQAVITLANGQRFQGSWTKNPEEAAESAAGQALMTLQSGPSHFSPNQQGSQQRFTPSPNSAFTPIKPGNSPSGHQQHLAPRGYQQPPPFGNMPFRSPNAPHGHMPHRPLGANFGGSFPPQKHQFHQYHHQQGSFQGHPGHQGHQGHQSHQGHKPHGWNAQHKPHQDHRERRLSRSQGEEEQVKPNDADKTPKKNPFVPLQVQVQHKTPRKKQESESSAQNVESSTNKLRQQVSTDGTAANKPAASKPRAKRVAIAVSNDNSSNSETANKSKAQPRRPKSRIAANFGTPAQ